MHIQINTEQPLTEIDLAVLRALAGIAPTTFPSPYEGDTVPAVDGHTPKKRAPRKPKAVEPKEEVAASEEKIETARAYTEEEEQAALDEAHRQAAEEPKVDPKELINDAAERAVKLIRSGKRDEVKAILDRLGLEKVTALKDSPEQVQPFLDAISALEAKDD